MLGLQVTRAPVAGLPVLGVAVVWVKLQLIDRFSNLFDTALFLVEAFHSYFFLFLEDIEVSSYVACLLVVCLLVVTASCRHFHEFLFVGNVFRLDDVSLGSE